MPDIRAFMASGYFNGKIYLVGGYSTGNISPAFLQTWEYDPVAKRQLGNFPQAFSHIAFVNAAFHFHTPVSSFRERSEERPEPGEPDREE